MVSTWQMSRNIKSNSTSRILYLGLELPEALKAQNAIHYPIIQIVPRPLDAKEIQEAFCAIPEYSHLIFTSRTTVHLFFEALTFFNFKLSHLQTKQCIAVGKSTAQTLQQYGIKAMIIARDETAEGIVEELKQLCCQDAYFFWPHSAHSRSVITNFLRQIQLKCRECLLYETHPILPQDSLPDLSQLDEIIFTSPSTVDAFIAIFGQLPTGIRLTSIGPITHARLSKACLASF